MPSVHGSSPIAFSSRSSTRRARLSASDHENRVTPFPGVALHVDSSSSVSKRRCACMETSLSVFDSDGSLRRNIRWGKGRGLS